MAFLRHRFERVQLYVYILENFPALSILGLVTFSLITKLVEPSTMRLEGAISALIALLNDVQVWKTKSSNFFKHVFSFLLHFLLVGQAFNLAMLKYLPFATPAQHTWVWALTMSILCTNSLLWRRWWIRHVKGVEL